MGKLEDSIQHLRRDFHGEALEKSKVPKNPMNLLEAWLDAAIKSGIREPNAFVISTSINGQPDSRVVLLRGLKEDGLVFYTNYKSQKARELLANPLISINFFWKELDRQIRLKASVEKLSEAESDAYFASRPRESQIGAWASKQSSYLINREELEKKVEECHKRFEGQEVPRPDFWGGFYAKVFYFEFWQGRENRLHDRIIYHIPEKGKWKIDRLSP